MTPVRVVLVTAGLPQLLRDMLVEILSAWPSGSVVGQVDDGEVLPAVERTGANVVVLGLRDGELPAVSRQIVREHPDLTIAGVSPEGRSAIVFRLGPHRVVLNDLSPSELVGAIWTAVSGAEI